MTMTCMLMFDVNLVIQYGIRHLDDESVESEDQMSQRVGMHL